MLIFTAVLAGFDPAVYGGSGYGTAVVVGFLFSIAATLRFYVLSFWIADIKMAQTVYFYGSLASTFVLWEVFLSVVFSAQVNGNVTQANLTGGYVLVLIDPAFGWFIALLFQHNLFGVLTQNPGQGVLSDAVCGAEVEMLVISCLIYFGLLCIMEGTAADIWRIITCYNRRAFDTVLGEPAGSASLAAGGRGGGRGGEGAEEEDFTVTDQPMAMTAVVAREPPLRVRGE